MKKYFIIIPIILLSAAAIFIFKSANKNNTAPFANQKQNLTVYTYDSLSAEWGLIPTFIKNFEKENNAIVTIITFPDTGTMLNQLILEKNKPKADIVMGLDNINFASAQQNQLLQPYKPTNAEKVPTDLWFDNNYTMTPFDYGYVGFVYNSKKINFDKEISLKELASDKYKNKIIIEQPGLSSPGTQLLLWSKIALNKNDYQTFWQGMKKNILKVTPDWGTAYYSLFLKDEAPIVLSYLTSPAYHIDQEKNKQYKAIAIKEGYFRQVEGVGLINNAKNAELAKKYIDYVLTDSVQKNIPTTQWMFPILASSSSLPVAYSEIITPQPKQILSISNQEITNNFSTWLKEWNKLFGIE